MILLSGSIRGCLLHLYQPLWTGWSISQAGQDYLRNVRGRPSTCQHRHHHRWESKQTELRGERDKWTVQSKAIVASCWLPVFLHLPGVSGNLKRCKERAPGGTHGCAYPGKGNSARSPGSLALVLDGMARPHPCCGPLSTQNHLACQRQIFLCFQNWVAWFRGPHGNYP